MTAFVPPTWFEGMLIWIGYIILPLIIGAAIAAVLALKEHEGIAFIVIMLTIVFACVGSTILWFEQYEVASVQEKVITVDDWQPTFGRYWGDVKSADDLMLKTSDGELFGNEENFLFQKFATRDILDQLKPNGTYKIKYYGWREGFNNGIPNILDVEQVIDENNTPSHHDISNYMNKRSIVYDDGW